VRSLNAYDPAIDREWAAIAQERIRQIKSGEVAPLDGEQVLKEMRQLAKQLAQEWVLNFILTLEMNFAKPSCFTAAEKFVNAVETAIAAIILEPNRFRELEPGVRTCRVSKFPYSILYT
jgi:putative addiction module component